MICYCYDYFSFLFHFLKGDKLDPIRAYVTCRNNQEDDREYTPPANTAIVVCMVFPGFVLDTSVLKADVFCWEAGLNRTIPVTAPSEGFDNFESVEGMQ